MFVTFDPHPSFFKCLGKAVILAFPGDLTNIFDIHAVADDLHGLSSLVFFKRKVYSYKSGDNSTID